MSRKRTEDGSWSGSRRRSLRAWARWLGPIALGAAAAACSRPEPAEPAAPAERVRWQSTKKSPEAVEAERRVFDLVNHERVGAGLPPLTWSARAAVIAYTYALEMQEPRDSAGAPWMAGAKDRVLVARIRDLVMIVRAAPARDADELHRELMSSPDGGAVLRSSSATHVGIGVVIGDEGGGRRRHYVTMLVQERAEAAEDGETGAAADGGPGPAAAGPPPAGSPMVPPKVLEGWRIAGSPAIVPDDKTKAQILAARRTKIIGSFKLCLATDGTAVGIEMLMSTGFPAYDLKIMREMRSWRYRPYEVDGKPVPVCTAVTFVYTQR